MRILITAGPTREFLDSVRFLSNASSGKMGYALATAAARRGHDVTLVSGPVGLSPPPSVKLIAVISAAEMLEASRNAFDDCDAAIMAAAVSDYRATKRLDQKIKRGTTRFTIELEPTTDICAELGAIKGQRIVVGFALEDHDPQAQAMRKLRDKRCDAIVLNSPENVGSDQAAVRILSAKEGWFEPFTGPKSDIADRLVHFLESLITQRNPHEL